MFKYDENPFRKGQWYPLVITSNGKKATITDNSLGAKVSDCKITLPKGTKVLDFKSEIDIKDKCEDFNAPTLAYSKGSATIIIPDAKNYETLTLYILA